MTEIPGFAVQIVDIYSAFNAVLADPGAFGITNTTDPCIPDGSQRMPPDPFPIPVTPTLPNCGDPNTYVFYDLVHPTTVLHREIANEFAPFLASANVAAPGVLWLLMLGGASLVTGRSMRADARGRPDGERPASAGRFALCRRPGGSAHVAASCR